MNTRFLSKLGALALVLVGATSAQAEMLVGLNAAASLFTFDSATPGANNVVPVTGLVGGQTLRSIDFRPSNGQLYGISSLGTAAQVYTINVGTGVATPVGAGFTLASATTDLSMDFNPVVDRIRVVLRDTASTPSGNNLRVNPITGALAATDTDYDYEVNDPGFPLSFGSLRAVAYTNNVAGALSTTLYGYEFNLDSIVTMGSVNGTISPNTGQLFTVGGNTGNTGIVTDAGSIGFDISGATGTAYINASTTGGIDDLYTVNLGTGALTSVGSFGFAVSDISVVPVPEPATLAVLGFGVAALRRRRKN